MILLENYLKEKSRIAGNALTPTGIIATNRAKGVKVLDVKNLTLNKTGAVPQIKKYLDNLNFDNNLIKFLGDILIIISALSKRNKQDNAKFESVFLDGEMDSDTFTINLTEEQSKNLESLNLSMNELNKIGVTFGEILSGIFLMNRYEPIKSIKYPLSYSTPLVDFLAITDTGLEYKISAKYKEGAPAAIKGLLEQLKPYVNKHKADPKEEQAELFVRDLFNILNNYSNPVQQIFYIWASLIYYIPDADKFFTDPDSIEKHYDAITKLSNSTQIINYIVDNKIQKQIYFFFKKIVFMLNNHKGIREVFSRWVAYANVHQVYLFDFIVKDTKTIKISFKIKSFKGKNTKFEFATKVNMQTPWKNGLNFKMIMD